MITGVLGGSWRASISPGGTVQPWDGSPPLEWHVAADDRWHSPENEAAVRQQRIDGTPAVETRVRIPNGDAVQRVYSVADHGGLTIVEVTNESPMPIAVAFTRNDLLTLRPPPAVPVEGIDLPVGSVVFPVGHQATIAVALSHTGYRMGQLPAHYAPVMQVVRGWTALLDRPGRYVTPDELAITTMLGARSDLALGGPTESVDADPVGFVLAVDQLVRMGERADAWIPDVADAIERAVRSDQSAWEVEAMLDAAERLFLAGRESRARRDLAKMRGRLTLDASVLPDEAPLGVRLLAWYERRIALPGGVLLPAGFPGQWLGANVECYGVPVGAESAASVAVRWHGERPAVLWEVSGAPVALSAPTAAPGWKVEEPSGEALWPAPAVV